MSAKSSVNQLFKITPKENLISELTACFLDQEKTYFNSQTHISPTWDYLLSSIFVVSPEYGIQSTMVVLIYQNSIEFNEVYYQHGVFKAKVNLSFRL